MNVFLQVIKEIGGLPAGALIAIIFLSPWGFLYFFFKSLEKQHSDSDKILQIISDSNKTIHQEFKETAKLFEDVTKHYEINLELLKDFKELSDDYKNICALNMQNYTRLEDLIKTGSFCPYGKGVKG
ncbi:MAG: hypothetical protein HQK89_17795 [Nitrospirae bacterium]|nr:hypothetical protein [Nitrospirota bacterium]